MTSIPEFPLPLAGEGEGEGEISIRFTQIHLAPPPSCGDLDSATYLAIIVHMKLLNYRVLFRKEPEGGYTVTVPSLPGCITYGENIDNAVEMVREAIELYVTELKERGEEVPTDDGTFEYTLTVRERD